MAGRTPRVQDRSGFHRDWGNYNDPASLLPNQTFNPLSASEHEALEAGDVCWALGNPSMGAWNPSEGADALNLFGSAGTLQQGLVPRWWASK